MKHIAVRTSEYRNTEGLCKAGDAARLPGTQLHYRREYEGWNFNSDNYFFTTDKK